MQKEMPLVSELMQRLGDSNVFGDRENLGDFDLLIPAVLLLFQHPLIRWLRALVVSWAVALILLWELASVPWHDGW